VRERRPAIVHTTLFEANLAGRVGARLAGTPVVSTLANEMYGLAHRTEYRSRHSRLRAAQLSDALTARLTVRLHAVSAHVAEVMARRLHYPRGRIDVIPRGRDPDALGRRTRERRDRTRERLGVAADSPLVIVVARQEYQKGLDVLIKAIPRVARDIPATRVVVAGRPGNATASLHDQLRRTGRAEALEFLGARSDVADLLCGSDVFVLPTRREGLSGALLEAMALECPVVVSDLPQIREVVDDDTALLVPPEDPEALGAAIVSALSNRTSARQRAVVAHRRFLERFTIDAIADQMVAFYRRALRLT
jgi:glycosyltransferase involved in cell wall biosynthesis